MKVYSSEQIKGIENFIISNGYGSIHKNGYSYTEISFRSRFHTLDSSISFLFQIRQNYVYFPKMDSKAHDSDKDTFLIEIIAHNSKIVKSKKYFSFEQFLDILLPYVKRKFMFHFDLFEGTDV